MFSYSVDFTHEEYTREPTLLFESHPNVFAFASTTRIFLELLTVYLNASRRSLRTRLDSVSVLAFFLVSILIYLTCIYYSCPKSVISVNR